MSKEELYLKFPALLEVYNNFYRGSIRKKDNIFFISINLPNFPCIKNMSCNVFCGTRKLKITEQKSERNVIEFLNNLEFFTDLNFEGCNSNRKFQLEEIITKKWKAFLQELKSFDPNEMTIALDSAYSRLKFTNFANNELHFIEIERNSLFSFLIVQHSLPDCIDLTQPFNSLNECLVKFKKQLARLEEFYSNMNTIDELCYIVEPSRITTKQIWRIFKLTPCVYAKIFVDPFCPSAVEVNIIGPTEDVEKFREKYNENSPHWEAELDVHKNLLRIFEIMYFPMKQSTELDELPCSICYSYQLDDHVPLISCDNARCDAVFHVACLQHWFSTAPDERTYLSVTIAICPFCKEKLSASFGHLLDL